MIHGAKTLKLPFYEKKDLLRRFPIPARINTKFSPPAGIKGLLLKGEGAFFVTLSHYTSRAGIVILYITAGVMWKNISLYWMGEILLNPFSGVEQPQCP